VLPDASTGAALGPVGASGEAHRARLDATALTSCPTVGARPAAKGFMRGRGFESESLRKKDARATLGHEALGHDIGERCRLAAAALDATDPPDHPESAHKTTGGKNARRDRAPNPRSHISAPFHPVMLLRADVKNVSA
jgi:hypothetical protein